MKTAYFDCSSGISGDMILGALIDSGLPISKLSKEQLLIVVTHEPELFSDWLISSYLLQDGMLNPMTTLS